MDLPTNVSTGIVRVRLRKVVLEAGSPALSESEAAYGKVSFTPSTPLLRHIGDGLIIPTTPVTTHLDATGNADVQLMATDDTDLEPSGWSYQVAFDLDGLTLDSFNIDVPSGSDRELADIVPVNAVDPSLWVMDQATFAQTGAVSIATGASRLYNDSGATRTVFSVRASVGTAPSGSAVIVNVKKNGTTIFPTAAKPTIAVGTNTGVATPDTNSWASGEYLTVDVTQAGTGAQNLTVTITYR